LRLKINRKKFTYLSPGFTVVKKCPQTRVFEQLAET